MDRPATTLDRRVSRDGEFKTRAACAQLDDRRPQFDHVSRGLAPRRISGCFSVNVQIANGLQRLTHDLEIRFLLWHTTCFSYKRLTRTRVTRRKTRINDEADRPVAIVDSHKCSSGSAKNAWDDLMCPGCFFVSMPPVWQASDAAHEVGGLRDIISVSSLPRPF